MFAVHFTSYHWQALALPVQNDFQLWHLGLTDVVTSFRELSKWGTVAGAVASIGSLALSYQAKIPLAITFGSGIAWLIFSASAKRLEPEAKAMIQHFKDIRDGVEKFSEKEIAASGLK